MTDIDITTSGMLTDLYQFTMVQGYLEHDMHEPAVFELAVRSLPKPRNFLIAAGLETFIDYLRDIRFSAADLEWLASRGFRQKVLDFLSRFQFTGSIHALPEGTVFFPDEPMLRLTAPLPQAQLLETRAINLLHFQTVIASKAARMVLAAPDKQLVDFGLRRAHGAEAGLLAARASYLAGFAGTATVLAGQRFGVPTSGTMAHSFVEAHSDEALAFEHFATANPRDVTLLLDTYDTEAAAVKAAKLADRLARNGITLKGVRLDSGDLADHARRVRRILDEAGLRQVRIVASGGLDEHHLASLQAARAPIDGFGIGTRLDVSADAPYLDCAYKLVEYAGTPRRKRSTGKPTWPGRKQVHRFLDANGQMTRDLVALDEEIINGAQPLVEQVVDGGQQLHPARALADIRQRVVDQLAQLPAEWKSLSPAPAYPVEISPSVRALADQLDRQMAGEQ